MKTGEQGYSLVELLVVLALLGFISIAISGGIRFGGRVWERVQTTTEASERIRGTQNFLRVLIGRVYPRSHDAFETGEASFEGDARRLSFLSLAPDGIGYGRVVRVALEVEGPQGSRRLTLKREDDDRSSASRSLLEELRRLDFSFGTAQTNGEITWVDAWDKKQGVPELVRIRAAFDPKANVEWPDLVVHPMIDRDAGCIYDPVSFSCRHG